jgi:hypothetical protein
VCPPFYSSRGDVQRHRTPTCGPKDITDGIPGATNVSHLVHPPCAPTPAACVELACSRSFPGVVQVMMTMARAAVRSYHPLSDWTGTPPVVWSGRCLPAEWTGHIKCRDDTSPVSRADMRCILSVINVEVMWPRGLTSGSARWLTSWAIGHVAASGPRLSGERKRTGQSPNKCLHRTPVRP